ncbi:MAG: alpha/beta hydrolase [Opitutaceae bacterium]|nr:alpha/beta hydrolase [Opitutaceae bacterium]MBP9913289.1 alpha/beta hydrolase [Opitutaceae bacterium]
MNSPLRADQKPPVTESDWRGWKRLDFVVAGRPALLICPKEPAAGNPWIWRTEFFGHFPQADLALVALGWHVGYMNASDMYGSPPAMALFDAYYRRVTKDYGLAARMVLEGFSRGGLYAFNFAADYPERVAVLYLDAPGLDIRIWPGPRHPLWAECLACYGLTPEQVATAKVSPLDRIEPVVRAGIPIFGVSGDADEAVDVQKNLGLLEQRYRAAGGLIEVVIKPGGKHHPHSLEDPAPIVNFILQHARQ